jgi:hypothetical protein
MCAMCDNLKNNIKPLIYSRDKIVKLKPILIGRIHTQIRLADELETLLDEPLLIDSIVSNVTFRGNNGVVKYIIANDTIRRIFDIIMFTQFNRSTVQSRFIILNTCVFSSGINKFENLIYLSDTVVKNKSKNISTVEYTKDNYEYLQLVANAMYNLSVYGNVKRTDTV